MRNRLRQIGAVVLTAAFWTAVWQLLYMAVNEEILIVSPVSVCRRIGELAQTLPFWQAVGGTLLRVLLGFVCGVTAGMLLAVLSHVSRIARRLSAPVMQIVKATPVASFIILMMVFLKNSAIPVVIAFLMVLPIVWGNVARGLEEVERPLLETVRVFHLPFWRRVRVLYIPSVFPYFISSAVTALGLSWKAGVAAEVLCLPAGSVGKALYNAKIYLETLDVFAWTTVVVIISVLLEALLKLAVRRVQRTEGRRGV